MRTLIRFVKWLLTTDFIGKSVNITIGSNQKITVNGKGDNVRITVNGRKVDPKSEEGKRILAQTDRAMEEVGNAMEEVGKAMNEVSRSLGSMFKS